MSAHSDCSQREHNDASHDPTSPTHETRSHDLRIPASPSTDSSVTEDDILLLQIGRQAVPYIPFDIIMRNPTTGADRATVRLRNQGSRLKWEAIRQPSSGDAHHMPRPASRPKDSQGDSHAAQESAPAHHETATPKADADLSILNNPDNYASSPDFKLSAPTETTTAELLQALVARAPTLLSAGRDVTDAFRSILRSIEPNILTGLIKHEVLDCVVNERDDLRKKNNDLKRLLDICNKHKKGMENVMPRGAGKEKGRMREDELLAKVKDLSRRLRGCEEHKKKMVDAMSQDDDRHDWRGRENDLLAEIEELRRLLRKCEKHKQDILDGPCRRSGQEKKSERVATPPTKSSPRGWPDRNPRGPNDEKQRKRSASPPADRSQSSDLRERTPRPAREAAQDAESADEDVSGADRDRNSVGENEAQDGLSTEPSQQSQSSAPSISPPSDASTSSSGDTSSQGSRDKKSDTADADADDSPPGTPDDDAAVNVSDESSLFIEAQTIEEDGGAPTGGSTPQEGDDGSFPGATLSNNARLNRVNRTEEPVQEAATPATADNTKPAAQGTDTADQPGEGDKQQTQGHAPTADDSGLVRRPIATQAQTPEVRRKSGDAHVPGTEVEDFVRTGCGGTKKGGKWTTIKAVKGELQEKKISSRSPDHFRHRRNSLADIRSTLTEEEYKERKKAINDSETAVKKAGRQIWGARASVANASSATAMQQTPAPLPRATTPSQSKGHNKLHRPIEPATKPGKTPSAKPRKDMPTPLTPGSRRATQGSVPTWTGDDGKGREGSKMPPPSWNGKKRRQTVAETLRSPKGIAEASENPSAAAADDASSEDNRPLIKRVRRRTRTGSAMLGNTEQTNPPTTRKVDITVDPPLAPALSARSFSPRKRRNSVAVNPTGQGRAMNSQKLDNNAVKEDQTDQSPASHLEARIAKDDDMATDPAPPASEKMHAPGANRKKQDKAANAKQSKAAEEQTNAFNPRAHRDAYKERQRQKLGPSTGRSTGANASAELSMSQRAKAIARARMADRDKLQDTEMSDMGSQGGQMDQQPVAVDQKDLSRPGRFRSNKGDKGISKPTSRGETYPEQPEESLDSDDEDYGNGEDEEDDD